MASVDLYFSLGLTDTTASSREIKKAYIKLARQLHPDKNFGKSSDRFLLVQVAYEVLSDPVKRRLYTIGRERRNGSFGASSSSSSSSTHTTPTRKRRPPAESYEWAKDVSDAASKREADFTRFNKWKKALFQDLDDIERSLRTMAPSPQKVDLLRSMIDRVDHIRTNAMHTNYSIVDSGNGGQQQGGMVVAESSNGDIIVLQQQHGPSSDSDDDSIALQKPQQPPSDAFLAFLEAKKNRKK
jgi:hypothetical protein